MNRLNTIMYLLTSISLSTISPCSDTMANTLTKILVGTFVLLILAINLTIVGTLILIASDVCEYFQQKVIKCSPGNDSVKFSTTKMPLLPVPPLEIIDSKLLSTFRKIPLPKQTSSLYIPLTVPKSQKRSYRFQPKQNDVTSHYPLSRIPLKSVNKFTTQIPPYDGPVIPFPRPG